MSTRQKKLVSIHDLYSLKYVREISLSPDGTKIAFTIEWLNKKKNKYFSNLYVVTDDGKIQHFVRGNKNINKPQWSPDGKKISYILTEVVNNVPKQNLWAIPADGGEAYAITDARGFFDNYQWTPDGKNIICEFLVREEDKERIPEKGKPPLYYHIKDTWYKLDGKGILPKEKSHIWKVSVKSGRMKQLTFGPHYDESPDVSGDGKYVVFTSNRQKNWLERFSYIDIYVIDINGKKERRIKTAAGPKYAPTFSPDGRHIAYLGFKEPEKAFGWRKVDIWLVPTKRGKTKNLTGSFDRTIPGMEIDDLGHYAQNRLCFSNDGKYIYYNIFDQGDIALYRISIKTKEVTRIIGMKEVIYAFDSNGKDTFALAVATPTDAGNVYIYKNRERKRLTDFNKRYRSTHRLSQPEELWFKGDKGDRVQGWLLKPPNFRKNKKYPLIVQIHGGPYAGYGHSLFHEFQLLAANGYCVFYSNPHGSLGYGVRFAKALHNKWGIPDTKDILKAVRILRRRSYIDAKRMGVMGGSYGGFMTNWIIGHTNIFKVAVTMRSVVNMISFFTSDFGFAWPKEFKGFWWDKKNFSFYWNMSPIKYIKKMRTPLLIIHSEQDHRCPISQAEELFVALKLLKREVEMVRFPLEPHGLSRHGSPRRREKRLEFILDFIGRYLK